MKYVDDRRLGSDVDKYHWHTNIEFRWHMQVYQEAYKKETTWNYIKKKHEESKK